MLVENVTLDLFVSFNIAGVFVFNSVPSPWGQSSLKYLRMFKELFGTIAQFELIIAL